MSLLIFHRSNSRQFAQTRLSPPLKIRPHFSKENSHDHTRSRKEACRPCKEDKNVQAVETLYSPSIVSIEAMSMPGMPAKMEGLDAIKKKNKHFMDTHTIH